MKPTEEMAEDWIVDENEIYYFDENGERHTVAYDAPVITPKLVKEITGLQEDDNAGINEYINGVTAAIRLIAAPDELFESSMRNECIRTLADIIATFQQLRR